MCVVVTTRTTDIHMCGRIMADNLETRMANISRRLPKLKAQRNVDVSQIAFLQDQYPFSFSLVKRPDAGWAADFTVVTTCGGDPIVDVGVDGLPYGNVIVTTGMTNTVSGNTLTTLVRIFNDDLVNGVSLNIAIGVYALNGVSSTCTRTA